VFRVCALVVALVGCHHAEPTPRERVLAKLPGDAGTVIAADARVLASPTVRRVIDALRSRWPASLGCVIDTALASDQVGVALTTDGTTIIGSGRASVKCAAVSRIDRDLWIATIGAGGIADASTGSILDDARFARARHYLATAPMAATADSALLGARFLATAQADPVEGWLSVDVEHTAGAALEVELRDHVERMSHDVTTAQLAAHLHVSRTDTQIVVRLDDPADADLVGATRTLLAWLEAPATVTERFACPPLAPPITACSAATDLVVSSLATTIDRLAEATFQPIVSSGAITGLRLTADLPTFGLRRGDQVIAEGGRLVTSRDQLVESLRREHGHATMTIRRGATLAVFKLDEHLEE
jgi:hypothetical protein